MLSVVATSTRSGRSHWIESTSAPSGHDGQAAPRDGALPEVMGGQLREIVEEESNRA
ncbi:hypothetical protein GCM10023238_29520 [Streptomyces heliomycini]